MQGGVRSYSGIYVRAQDLRAQRHRPLRRQEDQKPNRRIWTQRVLQQGRDRDNAQARRVP